MQSHPFFKYLVWSRGSRSVLNVSVLSASFVSARQSIRIPPEGSTGSSIHLDLYYLLFASNRRVPRQVPH
ncbi:hypothetical protein SERLADRAFT_367716 [Serpula lacrymans var. lacrymans S7.9]|uniref:Uncharacterized protein n=1 Tax=Serpula lacrymans var. lacrymans (strain S7.9) TaxID=578457 RepID=F8NQF8_SERL9|nr:uncharacterized protein SERLADRAFT_367716 [Serpula lacrymans var. lacrymans S7.9]EGO26088.1 hypothetical protein SERLADRAFT_367716 [Serpula lacrymans var. lacrymans S7.9]